MKNLNKTLFFFLKRTEQANKMMSSVYRRPSVYACAFTTSLVSWAVEVQRNTRTFI